MFIAYDQLLLIFSMVFPSKMVMFQSYVDLPEVLAIFLVSCPGIVQVSDRRVDATRQRAAGLGGLRQRRGSKGCQWVFP